MMPGIARTVVTDERLERADERTRELAAVFYDQYPRLWAVAFGMLGDAHLAEEAVMDAFGNAFSSWSRIRNAEHPHAYLRKIVLNVCRGKLRRRAIEHRVNALVHGRSERDPVAGWNAPESDARVDIWNALSHLPARQRACVVLRYFDDMTDVQVAETLDCSVGTVKSHLSRARRTLAGLLDELPWGDLA